ncbi:MAG: GNAT family N-acetyltransferase [Propionibacteriales bacterium]|nr:GNAT family N-acetyltransferase [Propionibacteriales bacterium]
MPIERVDPATLDDATAARCAEIIAASATANGVELPPPSAAGFAGQVRYTHDMSPVDAMWLARESGIIVGSATIDFPTWDNPQMAFVFCSVHPDFLGRGIGSGLLRAQVEAARGHDRTLLLTFDFRDTPSHRLLAEQGFELAQDTAQRRLRPTDLDWTTIRRYAVEAAAHATDYELVRLDGPAPDEWLPTLQRLHEAINDAPLDEIDLEPDVYPAERIRCFEQAMAARQQHLYRLMARHRETGEWAGHTILCVDRTRPGSGVQEDTSVVSTHRGHRLGMLLKATMLLWMREAEPGLKTIDTWNAESNRHMIAVNDALGCFVNARGIAMQLHLDDGSR